MNLCDLNLNELSISGLSTRELKDVNGGWLGPSILFLAITEVIDGFVIAAKRDC